MTTDLLRVAAACAALALFSLGAAAQNDVRSPTDTANGSAGRAPVRTPGQATGRPGGVIGSSTRSLPPETQSVRSPGKANPSSDQAVLNTMEHPVLERVNYYRTIA